MTVDSSPWSAPARPPRPLEGNCMLRQRPAELLLSPISPRDCKKRRSHKTLAPLDQVKDILFCKTISTKSNLTPKGIPCMHREFRCFDLPAGDWKLSLKSGRCLSVRRNGRRGKGSSEVGVGGGGGGGGCRNLWVCVSEVFFSKWRGG